VNELDVTAFEQKADELLNESVSVQESTDIATPTKTLVVTLPGTRSLSSDEMAAFTEELRAAYAENNLQSVEINNVDATIGREFLLKSIVAMALASVLIILYVGFRFRKIGGISAGAMGILALVHDVIIAFGIFVVFRIPIDDNFIAVILTILGFSINDTIVIYDRIRENKRVMGHKTPIAELVNISINQSFTRSLNTSIAAVMAMIVVAAVAFFYNVTSIQSFAIPMIFGLISGVYSTVCLAGPLWVKWQEHKQRKRLAQ
jgi:preprotein translocase SecF subunit